MAAIDTANRWIWQHQDWPHFNWDASALLPLLREVRLRQGDLLGQSKAFSHDDLRVELDNMLQSILTSSAIEGERFNVDSVRSSLAKRLGVDQDHPYPVSDRSEGVASMTLDAISNLEAPVTEQRLYQWQRWLFPDNDQSLTTIRVAQLRGNAPMQVVSGRLDRPVVHYEALPRQGLKKELDRFVNWFNASHKDPALDPLLRAGIAHFWFVTLPPSMTVMVG